MAGRHHEVVVIGAGIAGLRCAEQLIREKGVTDVLVVEALDRVGGRILSTTDFIPGMIVDIGAELVHGANTSLRKLAEQQNWSVREIFTWAQGDGGPHDMAPDGGIGYYYLGDQKRMLAYDDEDADFCAFNKAVGALGEIDINGIPASASVLEYFEGLNLSESMIKLAEAGYANTAGSRLEDISWRVTSRYEGQLKKQVCGESRLQSTFARVVDYVKEGVDIQLQFAVKSIDYSDSETIIVTSTNDERISCSKLVVTVPVSVFMDIEYMPALPQYKREAAESFGMRRAAKVLMHFNDSFWPSNTHGVICSDCFMPEFWVNSTAGIGQLVENGDSEADSGSETDSDNVQYLVTGFAGAECAEMLLQFSEQEIVDRFLAQLNMIYGTDDEPTPATKCFVRGMYFDWGNVEYIRGGYGFPRVGQSDHAAKDLASAIDNRIFFAGEATAFEQPGMTVHSALDTGTRAADEVAKAVAP